MTFMGNGEREVFPSNITSALISLICLFVY